MPPGHYTAISVGWKHACAITEDAEVVCWGNNEHGQTDAPPERYTAVDAAGIYTCALSEAGSVVCWGSYVDGTAAEAPSDTYTAIAVAVWGACA